MERRTFGGFIPLDHLKGEEWYGGMYRFNLGRTAIRFLVQEKGFQTIYLPCYLCDSLDQGLQKSGVKISRYHLTDKLLPEESDLPQQITDKEAVLLVNYFGLLEEGDIRFYKEKYRNLIVDNTQAFYAEPVEGVDTVYTCRKWFGVADGAYLYTDLSSEAYDRLPVDGSAKRMEHLLLKYEDENGDYYEAYSGIEESFQFAEIKRMSPITQNLMCGMDYERIARKRKENYAVLQETFDKINVLPWEQKEGTVPFMYPLYCEKAAELRKVLRESRCFLPLLWPNVLELESCWEKQLAENLLLLPCDQRYTQKDMEQLAELIIKSGGVK